MSGELAKTGEAAPATLVGSKPTDYPILTATKDVSAIIKKNFGERKLNPNLLPKVHVCSGELVGFSLPTLDDAPHVVKEFIALCILQIDGRRYWAKDYGEDTKSPPDCVSDDLVHGRGSPGGLCASCPYSEWGSSQKGGRGQACQDRKMLFLALPGDTIPSALNLPPTALGPVQAFFLQLAGKQIEYDRVFLKFTAAPAVNAGGQQYTSVKISRAGMLEEEYLQKWGKYCEDLIPFLRQRRFDQDFNQAEARVVDAAPQAPQTPAQPSKEQQAYQQAQEKSDTPSEEDLRKQAAHDLEELEKMTSQ